MAKLSVKKEYKVIQCGTCGSPLYYDAREDGFVCSSCGNTYPYKGDDGVEETSFSLMHIPLKREGDKLLLTGISKIHNLDDPSMLKLSSNEKWYSNQMYLERRKRVVFSKRKMFWHICPTCGGDVQAYESQNIWTCDYCGNRFAKEELLASGNYEVMEIVDTGNDRTPHFAIPFEISRDEAQRRILDFASTRPKAFAGIDLEQRVKNLWSVYIPVDLCDVGIVFKAVTENGSVLLFENRVNWTVSMSNEHSFYLSNDIGPWDLSKIVPFSQKLAEGDLLFDTYLGVGIPAETSRMSYVLRPELVEEVKRKYPSEDQSILWTKIDVRNRKMVMMPVYFLEREETGPKIRFMVNGQTGAVSVLGCGQMPGHKTLFTPGKEIGSASEKYMKSEPVPVLEESEGVYRCVSDEEGFHTAKKKIKFAAAKSRNKRKRKRAIKNFFARLFGRSK